MTGAAIMLFNADVPFEIIGNDIGQVSPSVGVGNAAGIVIQNSDTTHASEISLNRINDSTYHGVIVANSNLPTLVVNDNVIGADEFYPDFNYSFPNGGHGIWISDSIIQEIIGNTIVSSGGSGIFLDGGTTGVDIEQNVLLANVGAGIRIAGNGTVANGAIRNLFSHNGGLAIDLETASGPPVTANDPEDADNGPNKLLNFPEFVSSGVDAAGNWTVTYDVDVDKQGVYVVEFYRYSAATKTYEPLADSSNPQNPVYALAAISPTIATGVGKERFQTVITANFALSAGQQIVAALTAITGDNAGNTSEFSQPITLSNGAPRIVDVRLSGQSWARTPFSYATIVPSGKQLAPIYSTGVNKLEVKFSENIQQSQLTSANVRLYTSNGQTITLPTPSYNSSTHTATWTLSSVLPRGKYRLEISSAVTDVTGTPLDGDWVNDTNGTPDDFDDDPDGRTFLTGNGVSGGAFEFYFSVLPGDYDQDGIVETEDFDTGNVKDGNGDGTIDVDDESVSVPGWYLSRISVHADYDDNDIVWIDDYMRLKELWNTTDPDADGNGDGFVDSADWVVWMSYYGDAPTNYYYSAWYTGLIPPESGSGGGAFIQVGVAPTVTNVVVSGSQSTHAPYSFDLHDGSGEQLMTVPVGGADTISITFSEDVNVQSDHLTFVGLQTGNRPSIAEFFYDLPTMTATWRFDDLVANDHYAIRLSDAVTDVEGDHLDGEWTNPISYTTTNALVSEFPSGDGESGGHFVFVMTLLAGDAYMDLVTTIDDLSTVFANWGNTGLAFADGDFTGDGNVNLDDYSVLMNNWGIDLSSVCILADLDGNLIVDFDDLDILYGNDNLPNPTQADGDLDLDGDIDLADVDLAFAQLGLALTLVS